MLEVKVKKPFNTCFSRGKMSQPIRITCTSVLISALYSASVVAADYAFFSNAAIPGNNQTQIVGSVADCKDACDREDWCKSFDYYKQEAKCDLSDQSQRTAGGLKTDYPGHPYDHYEKLSSGSADTIDGHTVDTVAFGTGAFKKQGDGWIEMRADGSTAFTFEESGRDAASV
ncbi:MAG: PAN domain-containing protein, partial [Halieaceae bacterium]|nr:PAN domain-containing protein [Halieaceae bacterium]